MSKISQKLWLKLSKHTPGKTGKFEKKSGNFPGKILPFPGNFPLSALVPTVKIHLCKQAKGTSIYHVVR